MTNLISCLCIFLFAFSSTLQNQEPDFTKDQDLKMLGAGKIIQKDNSTLNNIHLLKINEYWITYEKNSSSHDMTMDVISRIEFPASKYGPLCIEFPNNKPKVNTLNY